MRIFKKYQPGSASTTQTNPIPREYQQEKRLLANLPIILRESKRNMEQITTRKVPL
jgi:hypothetical protein